MNASFFKGTNVCNSQEKCVRTRCAAIVNHYAILTLLRRANLLRRSIFSTAGSFGLCAGHEGGKVGGGKHGPIWQKRVFPSLTGFLALKRKSMVFSTHETGNFQRFFLGGCHQVTVKIRVWGIASPDASRASTEKRQIGPTLLIYKVAIGGVPTNPDPNTSAKVSRYKWEAYRDTNWWCIYYFLPREGHTFAKVSR